MHWLSDLITDLLEAINQEEAYRIKSTPATTSEFITVEIRGEFFSGLFLGEVHIISFLG